jgi:hypothetical protein
MLLIPEKQNEEVQHLVMLINVVKCIDLIGQAKDQHRVMDRS